MSWLSAALEDTADLPQFDSLATFRSHIDPEWIDRALEATGTATLRKRRLPAEQVLWLVLGMGLMRDKPIDELVSKLDLVLPDRDGKPLAKSSIVAARKRLGAEPVKWLFERCSEQWAHASARTHEWRGLAVYGVDGTTLRVPDSDQNREHFGLASGGNRADSAYPLVRLVVLMALRSHLLAAASFGPYAQTEGHYAEQLWERVPSDSLTILDRYYLAAKTIVELQDGKSNRHWLMRAKTTSKWTVLENLGPKDDLVEFQVSKEARRKDPSLPETYVARAVGYEHPDSKGQQWLLTSLTQRDDYPASELITLYHERWELEISYDEIKTHMLEREEAIRSRTVVGVNQELWGILLAFNLIRLEIEKIAELIDVAPTRVRFTPTMRLIRDEWLWCEGASPGVIPKYLRKLRENVVDFVLPPRRSARRFRREVKLKMSKYPKKWREGSTSSQKKPTAAKKSKPTAKTSGNGRARPAQRRKTPK